MEFFHLTIYRNKSIKKLIPIKKKRHTKKAYKKVTMKSKMNSGAKPFLQKGFIDDSILQLSKSTKKSLKNKYIYRKGMTFHRW